MEFALIRHTRCDIAADVCYGHLDIPLANTAPADIEQTLLRVPPIDVVYSSPSQRCQALAQALALREGCELRTRPDLRELNFGAWEGLAWNDVPRTLSDEWAVDPWNLAPPGGESESQLWQRVARVAGEVLQIGGCARIAIVSHGGPLRHLRCLLSGASAAERWSWRCELGEVTLIAPPGSAFPSSDP
jgi:alpha-ribazole phosphatase